MYIGEIIIINKINLKKIFVHASKELKYFALSLLARPNRFRHIWNQLITFELYQSTRQHIEQDYSII
jgi:hypothetical protein